MKLYFTLIVIFFSQLALGQYFDPHNHINGVLDPFAYANLTKVYENKEPTAAELASLWQSLRILNSSPKFQSDSRVSVGTKASIACDDKANLQTEDEIYKNLKKKIGRVLSATPLTSFDSAYAMRGYVEDEFLFKDKNDQEKAQIKDELIKATIFQLGQQKISLVEMSTNFIGGDPSGKRIRTMNRYNEIINDIKKSQPQKENLSLAQSFKQNNLKIPEIFWLLMSHTAELGRKKNELIEYSSGQCQASAFPEHVASNPKEHFYQALVQNPSIVGIDIASTETTCFTPEGMKSFKNSAKNVYEAAKERRKLNYETGPKKLLVHVHVGEGSPVLAQETQKPEEAGYACELPEKLPRFKETENNNLVHAVEARRNIGLILNSIQSLKRQYPDMDEYVVFRLGHATHISKAQANKAANLGVSVDVNLSSNLATGSWGAGQAIKGFLAEGEAPNKLLEKLLKSGADAENIFGDHGLKWLLSAGVLTVLGSDGAGVEHSSHDIDFDLAQRLIDYWNSTDKNFAAKNISIQNLIDNQRKHIDAMGYQQISFP